MKKIVIAAICALAAINAPAQLLYKVTSPKGDKTSYIFGTHHFAPVTMLDSIKGIDLALDNATKVYGEIDMADMTKPETMMKLQQAMMAPLDSTLDKVLSAKEMELLKQKWTEYAPAEIPFEAMMMLKPAAMSTQLAAFMTQKVLPPMDLTQQLDATMQARAKEKGKPAAGLETMEFQTNMLMGAPISEQAKDLVETLNDFDNEIEKAVQLTNAYLSQDMATIENLIAKAASENPESTEKLMYSRNDNWVKILKDEMQRTPLLVVVGAGHLPGNRGILNQLKNNGFTVTPVK